MTLHARIILLLLVPLAVLSGVNAWHVHTSASLHAKALAHRMELHRRVIEHAVDARVHAMDVVAVGLASAQDVLSALLARDSQQLAEIGGQLAREMGAVVFWDAQGQVVARSAQALLQDGRDQTVPIFVHSVLDQGNFSGVAHVSGRAHWVVARRVISYDGLVVGMVAVMQPITADVLAALGALGDSALEFESGTERIRSDQLGRSQARSIVVAQGSSGPTAFPWTLRLYIDDSDADRELTRLRDHVVLGPVLVGVFVAWMVLSFMRRYTQPYADVVDALGSFARDPASGVGLRTRLQQLSVTTRECGAVRIARALVGLLDMFEATQREHQRTTAELRQTLDELQHAMAQLHASERTISDIADNLPGFMYRCANDADWTMTYMSAGCLDVTGYSAEEFLGGSVTFNGIISVEYQEYLWNMWQDRLGRREPFGDEEYTIVHKHGALRWVWERGHGVFDDTGALLYLEGFIMDITDRRQAQQELLETTQRFQLLVETLPVSLSITTEDGRLLFVNPKAYEQFEIVPEEQGLRSSIFYWAHPEQRAEWLQRIRTDGFISNYEIQMRTVRGRDLWVLASGLFVEYNGEKCILSTQQDITDRKLMEQALRRSEERYRRLVETAREGIAVIQDERVVYCNPMLAEITAYPEQELQGMVLSMMVHPDDWGARGWAALRLRGGQGWERTESRIVRRDGQIAWVEVAATDLEWNNRPAVLLFVVDSTQRVVAQEQLVEINRQLERTNAHVRELAAKAESASRAKSSFLANMSHEIRTPMNAIMGMAHVLMRSACSHKQRDLLSKINTASHALLNIINDILDLSKIEAGRLELERIPFALEDVLASLSSVLGVQAEEKGLELVYIVTADTPRQVIGDPLRLGQVLINLVGNALKFTAQGEIVVTVFPEFLEQQRRGAPSTLGLDEPERSAVRLRFSVRDTGIGMDSAQTQRVFQPFTQLDASTTRKYGGTGLGLAICKQLIELMGGSIQVSSEAGRGSLFSFDVLVERTTEPAFLQTAPDGLAEPLRIMVVDDNVHVRQAVLLLLEPMGVDAVGVEDGAAAARALAQAADAGRKFDVLLIDAALADAQDLTEVWERDDRLAGTRRILMVAGLGRDDGANRVGTFDGIVVKPVRETPLRAEVRNVMQPAETGSRGLVEHPQLDEGDDFTGRRILVVDDNSINRDLVRELLLVRGADVEMAENGFAGVHRATEEQFDLILMDIQMPEMDGLEAAQAIRQHEGLLRLKDASAARRVPIIAMTAHATRADHEKSLAAGMDDHLVKPLNPAQFYGVLQRFLGVQQGMESVPTPDGGLPVVEGVPDLPDFLPPFDLQAALMRCNANQRLLLRLLRTFGQDYADAAGRLRSLLAGGDDGTALRLAHSLKGVAATLEAEELRRAAMLLETALRARVEQSEDGVGIPVDELVRQVETALIPALQAVAALSGFSVEGGALSEDDSADRTESEPQMLLDALTEQIRAGHMQARKTFIRLRENVVQPDDLPMLKAVGQDLERLDFDAALGRMPAVRQEMAACGLINDDRAASCGI